MAKLIVPQLRRQKHGADFFAPVKMNAQCAVCWKP
ncbi:hypothetical protein CPT_Sciku_050 [Escherichia phage Sciku]|nr:hypothetical protein CPT_Shashou_053 [Escherichia phage Shashou]QEG06923.1 hypothetical protein CPT_Sciku_050 [Escherichia phage Sciku]QEG06999.1 hypothetical protein CPT_Snoke_053 [Escherichia phage Snoke]